MKPANSESPMAADEFDPDGTLENLARYIIVMSRYETTIYDRQTRTTRRIYNNDNGNTIFIASHEDAFGIVVGQHPME